MHLCHKAIRTASQLRSGLQSKKQWAEQVQASYNNMVSIADGFKGIIGKLEPVANKGHIMVAWLEMLHSRTKVPSIQMGGTPTQQLASIIEELEALR